MSIKIYPAVKELCLGEGCCRLSALENAACSDTGETLWWKGLPQQMLPGGRKGGAPFRYTVGAPGACEPPEEEQGYTLAITHDGIVVQGTDRAGLRYGLDTLRQLVMQAEDGVLPCLTIRDFPALKRRGLMLDVSRGKVYTRTYLLNLVELLSKLRYNVLQLYVEHTFAFRRHPEISEGSDPLTAEDVLAIQAACKERGIELQANLQSLGHFRRILTRPEHRHLAESDLFWSLSTTSEDSFRLLDELYGEYLPLFESPWLNVCLDEPYDLGCGKSAEAKAHGQNLYLSYFERIHQLAAKYGKRIMAFADVFLRDPDGMSQMPADVIYLDWCYDPKKHYGTPARIGASGRSFWVCPGTGNWNTLFPRVDGAVDNIAQMVSEGVEAGAEGMLLTDWNDHGAYAQAGPGYYIYAYGGAAAWQGDAPDAEAVSEQSDCALGMPGYARVVRRLAEIYRLPPFWSKNRSQCVMALFDEPVFGKSVRGLEPPSGIRPYDLALPEGIRPVLERHSHHPLRPCFQITSTVCDRVREIVAEAAEDVAVLPDGPVRAQFSYILEAFTLMADKLAFSRGLLADFRARQVSIEDFLELEDQLRLLIKRYVHLQMTYTKLWLDIARPSEIELSLTYFAHIIERLDYLWEWLSVQREETAAGREADYDFVSYETAGYTTLPTY